MSIPRNGGVVVIDDKPEDEGLPLLRALSSKGIPATYFTGEVEEMPENPLSGIRAVFLDIVLGTEGQDEKTKISKASAVLGRIIGKDNSPFLLIAWTKHEELLEGLNKVLKSEGLKFILIDLEKNSCKNGKGEYAVNIISTRLQEKLKEIGVFHLFILWESLVHGSSDRIVSDFSEFYSFDKNWNRNMTGVFLKLAEGFAGKQLNRSDNREIVKNALLSFNGAFLDTLESEIGNYDPANIRLSFNAAPGGIDKRITGDINSKLLFAMESGVSVAPGCVYRYADICRDGAIKQSTLIYDFLDPYKTRQIFLEEKKIDAATLSEDDQQKIEGELKKYAKKIRAKIGRRATMIVAEVSPYCDYAQRKWKVTRILVGLLCPHSEEYDSILKRADFVYASPIFLFEGHLYRMLLDLRYFSSIEFSKFGGRTPLFRLKYPLLVEIQSKLASHVHRPGVIFVG